MLLEITLTFPSTGWNMKHDYEILKEELMPEHIILGKKSLLFFFWFKKKTWHWHRHHVKWEIPLHQGKVTHITVVTMINRYLFLLKMLRIRNICLKFALLYRIKMPTEQFFDFIYFSFFFFFHSHLPHHHHRHLHVKAVSVTKQEDGWL